MFILSVLRRNTGGNDTCVQAVGHLVVLCLLGSALQATKTLEPQLHLRLVVVSSQYFKKEIRTGNYMDK